jgi:WD40 repeat protein
VRPLIIAGSDPDPLIAERARSVLWHLKDPDVIETLCAAVLVVDDEVLREIARQAGYAPSAPAARAAILALSGRWLELDAFDLDGLHLRAAYETAAPEVRCRLAAAAREGGRAEWVQVVVGGRRRLRLAQMTRSEWQDVLALLADPVRAKDAWRLAEEAPPWWARELLLGISADAFLPECDCEDFARLRALAVQCGEAETPFCACTTCIAALRGHERSVDSLAVTPDSGLLASGSGDTIRLWRLPDGECVATLQVAEDSVTSVAITPDGSLLASGSFVDSTVCLWDLPDGECVKTLEWHEGSVTSVAITPDGSLLASGSNDKTICLWRLPDGECVAKLRGHEGVVTCLAVTPDSSLLASGSNDNAIRLWRLPDGPCKATLRGHADDVESLTVTPDGSLLASTSSDRTLRLWSLPDGECVATLQGHESVVGCLAATPDGSLLAGGSDDGTIHLWRLPDGECVATLHGHEREVTSLAVTPDGSLLASGSFDGTIRLWHSDATVPAGVLALDIDRLRALRCDDGSTGRERSWLDFMLALVDRYRRFDVEIEVSRHIEAGEFDIEIGN